MQKRIVIFLVMMLVTLSCSIPIAAKVIPTSLSPSAAPTTAPTNPPSATPVPTLTPTPTPPPAVRVELAEQALFLGNYENARREFQEAQGSTTDPEVQAAAAFGIGRSLYLSRNYSTAIDTFKSMVETYPQSPYTANAYYFLARSYEATEVYDLAAEACKKFLEIRPGVLDAYIQEQCGDDYFAAGNPAAAAEAYAAAVQAPQEGTTIWVELKLGKAYSAMGDFSSAIKKFLEIYEKSDNDYARAQANLLMGQAYLTMGMPEQANARFLDSVASFPKAYDTYSGLVILISNGVGVNDLGRGLVDYYAGQYGLAIDALTRYIEAGGEEIAKAHYFRALSFLAQNQPEDAIKDWDQIITNYSGDGLWASAWEEKAYTLWAYLDKYDEAADVLLQYIAQVPDSSLAPEYLFQAARILERNSRFTDAAAAWERLIDTYPSAEKSYRGLFLAGIAYYRAGDYAKALTVFQRALVLAGTPIEQSAAYLWTGKTQQVQGNPDAARTAWEQAAQRDPTGYYSERANELLQNQTPFQVNQPVDLGYNLVQERIQAEEWLRTTFSLSPETDLNGLGELAADPRMVRGAAFWDLGLYDESRNEFEALRQSVLTDPVQTYRLMNSFLELGLYRSAILASRQILDLANLDDIGTLKAPAYFNHIRFGIFYKDLILQASQEENLHPLFLLSVLRQESMFEGFADSGAGARGLMQIMPATGQEIASSMNWPDYTVGDLYRPEISITFGARYLARQRDYFEGSLYTALAAYNGGPGNAIIWNQLAGNDPDLLLEVIRADETRSYIIQIYEFFNIYRLLYQRGY
jgi:soluble lytic murein transglycosylase